MCNYKNHGTYISNVGVCFPTLVRYVITEQSLALEEHQVNNFNILKKVKLLLLKHFPRKIC